MASDLIPMQWPSAWTDPAPLRGIPINCILGNPRLTLPSVTVVDQPPPGTKSMEGVWASIRIAERGSGGAGPTGRPWIESNGWKIQLERAVDPASSFWVSAAPATGRLLRPEDYLLMIADAEAYGARWIVSIDDTLAKGVASGDKAAVATWKRIADAARFFQTRRVWNSFELVASVGLISDFAGDNEFLGHEILNLAARRPLPLRILPKAKAASMDWTGLQAIVLVETAKPCVTGELLAKLTEFVNRGGLLIAPEKPFGGTTLPARHGYHVWTHGKGEVCVPVEAWSDPFLLAADVHLLVGRENDVLRLYNAASANVLYSRARAGNRGVIQILNYSTRAPATQVTVATPGSWKRATLFTLDQPVGAPLVPKKTKYGVEFALPPFPVYAAIEVES